MRHSVVELYEKAKKIAVIKGRAFEAEDFAGWYAKHILEGRGAHQTMSQAFIEYLRTTYGDSRTASHRVRQSAEINRVTITATREREEGFELGEDELEGVPRIELPNGRVPFEINEQIRAANLEAQERCMIWLRHGWNFTEGEIANCFGITESRICQRLSGIHKRLQETLLRGVSKSKPGMARQENEGMEKEQSFKMEIFSCASF